MHTTQKGSDGATAHAPAAIHRRLVIGGGGLFLLIWGAYAAGLLDAIDAGLLRTMAIDAGPHHGLAKVFAEWTALGSLAVLALVTTAAAALLIAIGERRRAGVFFTTVLSAWAASQILKAAIARPRPDIFEHLVAVSTKSLPSGHAMMSLVVYGALALMVPTAIAAGRARRTALWLACLAALLIGASRVLLAVHWPSDVLAGWALGVMVLGIAAPWLSAPHRTAAARS